MVSVILVVHVANTHYIILWGRLTSDFLRPNFYNYDYNIVSWDIWKWCEQCSVTAGTPPVSRYVGQRPGIPECSPPELTWLIHGRHCYMYVNSDRVRFFTDYDLWALGRYVFHVEWWVRIVNNCCSVRDVIQLSIFAKLWKNVDRWPRSRAELWTAVALRGIQAYTITSDVQTMITNMNRMYSMILFTWGQRIYIYILYNFYRYIYIIYNTYYFLSNNRRDGSMN